MEDLELAKKTLKDKNFSLTIVKGGKLLFESSSSGINGLLKAIGDLEDEMEAASVADKIVGRAAALLLAYSQVSGVYAMTLSKEGLEVLSNNGIFVQYDTLVPKILDKTGKSICPFERFSLGIRSVDESYEKLRTCSENFRKAKSSTAQVHIMHSTR